MDRQEEKAAISKNRGGRPRGAVKPATAMVRARVATIAIVDAWAAAQPAPRPSRTAALHILVARTADLTD